jgi:hypothetical protein
MELIAEALTLISVLLIWLPAYRLSSQLLVVSELERIEQGNTISLGQLAGKVRELVEREIPRFRKSDVRLLAWGFAIAVASSLLKLGLMLAAD